MPRVEPFHSLPTVFRRAWLAIALFAWVLWPMTARAQATADAQHDGPATRGRVSVGQPDAIGVAGDEVDVRFETALRDSQRGPRGHHSRRAEQRDAIAGPRSRPAQCTRTRAAITPAGLRCAIARSGGSPAAGARHAGDSFEAVPGGRQAGSGLL
jgi:hypothetical protein